jgi:hypothetical protein
MGRPKDILLSELSINFSQEQLIDLMHQYRDIREQDEKQGTKSTIGVTISGHEDDPRELGEIPVVRQFCQRLVQLGFVADLTPSLMLFPDHDCPLPPGMALGSLELWCISQKMLGRAGRTDLERARLAKFPDAILQANKRADSVLRRVWHTVNPENN